MNKQIALFATLAFDHANDGNITDIKIPKEFIEKFAELIVKECAFELSRMPSGYDSSLFYNNSKLLKEHFGIEQ